MKNNFAAEYARDQVNYRNFDEAEARGDEVAMQAARDAHHAFEADIEAKGADYANIYRLYESAQERSNELIDIDEVVWDRNVAHLVDSFRHFGIERFTFSSGWSDAVETAWLFTQNGCSLEGIIEINSRHRKIFGGEREKKHAFLFRVN